MIKGKYYHRKWLHIQFSLNFEGPKSLRRAPVYPREHYIFEIFSVKLLFFGFLVTDRERLNQKKKSP